MLAWPALNLVVAVQPDLQLYVMGAITFVSSVVLAALPARRA